MLLEVEVQMCRLFGMLSLNPSNGWKYLVEDRCSILIQSNVDPMRLQGDGWGIGFYTGNSPKIVKSEKPIYNEHERFKAVVKGINSNIIVAHIRRASNPRGLPREKLLSIENSQPFGYKNYIFAHNGVITIPDDVANLLGDWQMKIKGLNDSELYFWYIMKIMSMGKSLPEALKIFQNDLFEIWRENRDKNLDKDRPYIGLNMIFSDGDKLYAYCKYDEEKDGEARSICLKDQPAWQMSYIATPEKLVISSEKTNKEEEWRTLKSGFLIIGQITDGKIKTVMQGI